MREFPDSSFRPPELGQLFWSTLLLVVQSQEIKCQNLMSRLIRKLSPSMKQEASQQVPASIFSDEEIRVRAYQIYESSDRTNRHAEQDWFQAQTELMEMVGGK